MTLFIIVGVIVLAVSILNESGVLDEMEKYRIEIVVSRDSQGKISLSTIKTLRVLLLENTLP